MSNILFNGELSSLEWTVMSFLAIDLHCNKVGVIPEAPFRTYILFDFFFSGVSASRRSTVLLFNNTAQPFFNICVHTRHYYSLGLNP